MAIGEDLSGWPSWVQYLAGIGVLLGTIGLSLRGYLKPPRPEEPKPSNPVLQGLGMAYGENAAATLLSSEIKRVGDIMDRYVTLMEIRAHLEEDQRRDAGIRQEVVDKLRRENRLKD